MYKKIGKGRHCYQKSIGEKILLCFVKTAAANISNIANIANICFIA